MQIYDNTKFHILQYGVLHKLFPSNLYNLIFSSAAAFRSVGGLPGRNTMRRLPLRSPPRMRGKDGVSGACHSPPGITPACAGKSNIATTQPCLPGDHPRVCGEKCLDGIAHGMIAGSPPRVRGKDVDPLGLVRRLRITPAYAGKSALQNSW